MYCLIHWPLYSEIAILVSPISELLVHSVRAPICGYRNLRIISVIPKLSKRLMYKRCEVEVAVRAIFAGKHVIADRS